MSFMKEFKEFINRGNVMDLAVGVIIGGAFTAIVTSLTDSIINPLISLVTGGGTDTISALKIPVGGDQYIDFGAFIAACINFLIVAFVVFLLVKAVNKVQSVGKKPEEAAPEVIAPKCPYCMTEVPEGATKCPHCTSDLPEPAKSTTAA